jgi:hypothetical protein
MSETEVVDALAAMKATPDRYQKALFFLASSSRVSLEDAEDEISKLRRNKIQRLIPATAHCDCRTTLRMR